MEREDGVPFYLQYLRLLQLIDRRGGDLTMVAVREEDATNVDLPTMVEGIGQDVILMTLLEGCHSA